MWSTGLIIALLLLLATIIVGSEWARQRRGLRIDFLFLTNVVYLVVYAVVPLLLTTGVLSSRDRSVAWMFEWEFSDERYVYAALLALVGYGALRAGFHEGLRVRHISDFRAPADSLMRRMNVLWACALGLLIVGVASLAMYIRTLGGIQEFLSYGAALRQGVDVVKRFDTGGWSFLKNVAPLIFAASSLFFVLAAAPITRGRQSDRWLATFFCAIATGGSLLLLFHQAGRVLLLFYVMLFPWAWAISRNRVPWAVFSTGAVALIVLGVIGKQLFLYTLDPTALEDRVATVKDETTEAVSRVAIEFSFPYVNLGHVTEAVPGRSGMRYFVDVGIGALQQLPDAFVPFEIPDSVSRVNTDLLGGSGEIPTDILTFGYYSLGSFGVVIAAFVLGLFGGVLEKLLPPSRNLLLAILRVWWMQCIASRVMYGDPAIFFKTYFSLLVLSGLMAIAIFFYTRRALRGATRLQARRDSSTLRQPNSMLRREQ